MPCSSNSIISFTPEWPAPPGVQAVATTRIGGRSKPPCDTLNLGGNCGDDPSAVAANRAAVIEAASIPGEPIWLNQVHGKRVVSASPENRLTDADGCWTDQPGVACVVLTADCVPVLFCNRAGSRVAAAHAGWRGLAAGVLNETVKALGDPGGLVAWIGPCIRQAHYEVGDEVRAAFRDSEYAFVANDRGRWQFDLAAVVRSRLDTAGVHSVYDCERCTYADSETFFSHRRDGRTGRQAALIWIAK